MIPPCGGSNPAEVDFFRNFPKKIKCPEKSQNNQESSENHLGSWKRLKIAFSGIFRLGWRNHGDAQVRRCMVRPPRCVWEGGVLVKSDQKVDFWRIIQEFFPEKKICGIPTSARSMVGVTPSISAKFLLRDSLSIKSCGQFEFFKAVPSGVARGLWSAWPWGAVSSTKNHQKSEKIELSQNRDRWSPFFISEVDQEYDQEFRTCWLVSGKNLDRKLWRNQIFGGPLVGGPAWHSGPGTRIGRRRSWVRIPPGSIFSEIFRQK